MKDWSVEARPLLYARTAGAIYLLVILFGGYAEGVVMNSLVVGGDAGATARNILAAPDLWRLSGLGNMIVPLIAVPQMWIEYLLLRPVSRNGALLFLLFNSVSLALEGVSKLFLLMVVPILRDPVYAASFDGDQVNALSHLALSAHDVAFHITLLFFGCACLVSGWLIMRARYLPAFLGVLMQLAGACYLVAAFAELFAPALGMALNPWILLPVLVGESSLCLWLLIRGLNRRRWNEQLGLEPAG